MTSVRVLLASWFERLSWLIGDIAECLDHDATERTSEQACEVRHVQYCDDDDEECGACYFCGLHTFHHEACPHYEGAGEDY